MIHQAPPPDPAALASAPLPQPLLTKAQIADILGLSPRSVDNLISRRHLACIRFGRSVRIHPDDLARLIERRRIESGPA